jgi:electron transfer flavoprotein beta subunit
MKVVVAVKQVSDQINEWDTFAVEAALQAGDEVVVVGVGDDDEALLSALAMGADRAVRITTNQTLDPIATARLLAPVVQREAPDLVLCGAQSADAANGATPTALAALAGLNRVAVVKQLEVADGFATCERELEGGLLERVRVPLPALITVQTGINEPRYATLRGIRQASAKPLDVIEAESVRPAVRVVSLAPPPPSGRAELIEGGASEIAERIATIIKGKVA